MYEPELFNQTPFMADVVPLLDREGAQCRAVIVKASYQIGADGSLELLERQRLLRAGDEMWGVPEVPDVRYPGDFCVFRPGTDVIVVGHAQSPGGLAAPSVECWIRVSDRELGLRVYGPRVWEQGVSGIVPGPAEPFERVPLSWGNAWGGRDESDPERPLEEPRNPAGRGVARDAMDLLYRPAHQIEAIQARDWRHRMVPAGCAPLAASFEPRRSFAGTYDQSWLETRHPGRPVDYDPRHENRAVPELTFHSPLGGGEAVELLNISSDGPIVCVLPRHRIVVEAVIDGRTSSERPHLDTVLVDADHAVLELVWRASFRCPPKMRNRFTEVRVSVKDFR